MTTPRRDIQEMHLQEALKHLECAKAHLQGAGIRGTARLSHLDIAWRKLTQALSYTRSGMTIAGIDHKPLAEAR